MTVLRRSLLGALLLAAGLTRVAAGQAIPVRVGGEASSLVGVQFQVPIEVDLTARPGVKLGSFAMVMRWNPAVLRFDGGTDGTFGAVEANEDSLATGVAKLVGANPAGPGGRVLLGIAHFTPLVDAPDTFRVSVTELYAAGSFQDLLPDAVWADRAYCTGRGRYGDVNSNQQLVGQDALLVLSHAVGIDISAQGLPVLGDVDGDGVTGARDALIILSAAVGLDVSPFRVLRVAPGPCADARRPTFQVTPSTVALDLDQTARLFAVARDSLGNGLVATDVNWATSDANVATVNGFGWVTAVAPGTVTISAKRQGASSASASITVSDRRVHWVDAFAFAADSDQIGAPELPFQTIPQALDYADAGDTIKVRPGRYESSLNVNRPVVIMGDTSGGRPRPLIVARDFAGSGIQIDVGGRVELHHLRLDTLDVGVDVTLVDTLVLRGVQIRAPGETALATVMVDTARAVIIQHSEFIGPGDTDYGYSSHGVWAERIGALTIDSTLVTDFGSDGVYATDLIVLTVRHSTFRGNYGRGVYATGLGAVFTGNRLINNYNGHVYLDGFLAVSFDHNYMSGGGYDGIQVYGDPTQTRVGLRGDTVLGYDYGSWAHVQGYDTLGIDSVFVRVAGGGESFYDGRITTVRDSRFVIEEYGTAIYVDPFSRPNAQLVLRRVDFTGTAVCDRCGDGIQAYDTEVDADSVSGTNLDDLFDIYRGSLRARNVMVTHAYRGLNRTCGSTRLDRVTMTQVEHPIDAYAFGCVPDSLVVDSTTLSTGSSAIRSYNNYALITRTQMSNFDTGLEGDFSVVADSNIVAGARSYGFWFTNTGTLRVRDNIITGFDGGGGARLGAIHIRSSASDGVLAEVLRNRITGSKSNGIVLQGNDLLDTVRVQVDSNAIKGVDSVGIWVGGYSRANVRRNAVDSTGADAVRLSELFHGTGQVLVNENNFSRSRRYGVLNETAVLVNAQNNYWGAPGGPFTTAADSASANVDYTSHATVPFATLTPAPPLAPVLSGALLVSRPDAPAVRAPVSRPAARVLRRPPGVPANVLAADRRREALWVLREESRDQRRAERLAREQRNEAARRERSR